MELQEFIALTVVVALGVYFYMYWRKKQNKTIQQQNNPTTKTKKIIKSTKQTKPINKPQPIIQLKKQHKIEKKTKEDLVYLDIGINNKKVGKIVIKLHSNIVPKTCLNFRTLCEKKSYRKAPFHRIIKDFMIQGGDITQGNGRGGISIWGDKFDDENFKLKNEPYMVSMANSGPNTNGSQFFIITTPQPHLDGKHVVFGEVVDGFDIVDHLNEVNPEGQETPRDHIFITDCGLI